MAFVGSLHVPGDKSIAHRALLFAAMREGVTRVCGLPDAEDVRSTIRVICQLGARAACDGAGGPSQNLPDVLVIGWGGGGPQEPAGELDCGNSATTARLIMGVLAPWDVHATITGDASLRARPMRRVTEPLSRMGASFSADALPLRMRGTRSLQGIECTLPVASAQVKSAILLAGLFAHGETRVHEPVPSRNHTEVMLSDWHSTRIVRIPGDPSSAAFAVAAALLSPGSSIEVRDVCLNPTRTAYLRVLSRMGACVQLQPGETQNGEPVGTLRARYSSQLHAACVDAREIPQLVDELPVLALAAMLAEGETAFRGVQELRVKESDRLEGIVAGLRALGGSAHIAASPDGEDLLVQGRPQLRTAAGAAFQQAAPLESAGDHRMALLWQLANLCSAVPLDVRGTCAAAVSYPQFESTMRACTVPA